MKWRHLYSFIKYADHIVYTDSKEQMSGASFILRTHNKETKKEVNDKFFDRQSLGKKYKRKSSLTITQRKRGHHKPVHLTSVNKLLQKI